MTTRATVKLERLTCDAESDASGGSEPYLWPVLLRIDDRTLATPQLVSVVAPSEGFSRVELRQSMRAGQTADVPATVGVLRADYAAGQSHHEAILVVALWESDETPQHAVRAGYRAFVDEVGKAIADNLLALASASGDELEALIAAIKQQIKGRVRSAISDDLTFGEKAQVAIGTLNLDDIVDSGFRRFADLRDSTFTMRFVEGTSNAYELTGQFEARILVPDRCQAKVNAVREAQAAVDGVLAEIADLQKQLQGGGEPGEPRLPKAVIIAEIKRLRSKELPPLRAALDVAKAALKACRDNPFPHPVDPIDPVVVGSPRSPASPRS